MNLVMKKSLEREFKVMLNKAQYEQINEVLKWEKEFDQTNYYYLDEAKEIDRRGITVRVRDKNEKLRLQVKCPVAAENALHVKQEYEYNIDEVPEKMDNTLLKEICNEDFGELSLIGKLVTFRKESSWNEDISICLDRNSYLGYEDFELEIEFKDDLDENLKILLKENNITFEKKTFGKCRRFFRKYLKKDER